MLPGHFTINGNTERYHDLANIEPGADGKVIVSIFRGQARQLPFAVEMMERHPKGTRPSCRCPAGLTWSLSRRPRAPPNVADLRVFLARGDQGVEYATGVWHHPLLALGEVSDFLVIDRSGTGDNCDEVQLAEPGLIPACA